MLLSLSSINHKPTHLEENVSLGFLHGCHQTLIFWPVFEDSVAEHSRKPQTWASRRDRRQPVDPNVPVRGEPARPADVRRRAGPVTGRRGSRDVHPRAPRVAHRSDDGAAVRVGKRGRGYFSDGENRVRPHFAGPPITKWGLTLFPSGSKNTPVPFFLTGGTGTPA